MLKCENLTNISKNISSCKVLKEDFNIEFIPSPIRSGSPCPNCKAECGEKVPDKDNLTEAMKLTIQKNGKISLPTIGEQVKSFTKSIAEWAFSGFKNVPPNEQKLRLEICKKNTCGLYSKDENKCLGCGCFLEGGKILFSHETCPANLWPKLGTEYMNQPNPGRCGSCGNK